MIKPDQETKKLRIQKEIFIKVHMVFMKVKN